MKLEPPHSQCGAGAAPPQPTATPKLDDKGEKSLSKKEIEILISERNTARDKKNFKKSDEIRDILNDKGVLIEDDQNKTTWKYK